MTAVAVALLLVGLAVMIIAAVGILRLPDFFTRMHTLGKTDTLGIMIVLGAVAVDEGWTRTSLKLGLVVLFYFLVNPVTSHAQAHAALQAGLRPWQRSPAAPGLAPEATLRQERAP